MPFDWLAHQLRLTLFMAEPVVLSEKHWTVVTGEDEASSRNPIPGGKQYSGPFWEGLLSLSSSGARADLVLSVKAPESPPLAPTLPTIAPFDPLSDDFFALGPKLIGALPAKIVRVAVGSVLLCGANSRQESYEVLAKLIRSLKVDPTRMRELIYRVNWPRKSSVIDTELNMITAFSSLALKQAQLQIVMDGTQAISSVRSDTPMIHAARLDLDHSTSADNSEPFTEEVSLHIFEELVAMIRQNAASGECP